MEGLELLISFLFSSPLSFIPFAIVVAVAIVRQINQYERGVMLLMGRYTKTKEPDWRIVIQVFQRMIKVGMRINVIDVPD